MYQGHGADVSLSALFQTNFVMYLAIRKTSWYFSYIHDYSLFECNFTCRWPWPLYYQRI